MTNNSKNTYQITIYTPTTNTLFSSKNIHTQELVEANTSTQAQAGYNTLINTLKQQFPYTHFTLYQL